MKVKISVTPQELRELAEAQHRAFHDFYLDKLPKEIQAQLHSLVDTLVINLIGASDKLIELNAKLEQANHTFSLLKISKQKEK